MKDDVCSPEKEKNSAAPSVFTEFYCPPMLDHETSTLMGSLLADCGFARLHGKYEVSFTREE